jgi:hypothetical protein
LNVKKNVNSLIVRNLFSFLLTAVVISTASMKAQDVPEVGLYLTFERSLENNGAYSNKFTDVDLRCTFISPSGRETAFFGFFDGDGNGGGDLHNGNIWKIRFLPDEPGLWKYSWSWSDSTQGGEGAFLCLAERAGKGILRAYKENPGWFAYNGTDPVWIKSYYESGHGSISQPLGWVAENVYSPLINHGYNLLQVNWLLPLCCFSQYYHDGPAQLTSDLTLYKDGMPSSTMRLDVWHMMERHVEWLNNKNVGLYMFLGFDGSRNDGPRWENMSDNEKEFYVRYVVSRLAPYANIAGWNFVWEVPGNREQDELGWARLIKKYDVFSHLRTYEDESPAQNEFSRPEYTFAAIENHQIASAEKGEDRLHWKEAWTHHQASLDGYVYGKPVFMSEGNALWRRYWHPKCGATRNDMRQAAWACVTAGASFTWCGHQGEGPLMAYGPQGLPFYDNENEYSESASQMDILSNVMNNEVIFYRMYPADSLLTLCDPHKVWCLAERDKQYMVFSVGGAPFTIQLAKGTYSHNKWINTLTGEETAIPAVSSTDKQKFSFNPPDSENDWLLLILR